MCGEGRQAPLGQGMSRDISLELNLGRPQKLVRVWWVVRFEQKYGSKAAMGGSVGLQGWVCMYEVVIVDETEAI